jgi:hypothetical protein
MNKYYQKMIYFPENFGEVIEQFDKLIVKDKRYAEPKIKGKGSFSKFVRIKMLVYIKRRTEELMQEKEKKEKESQINLGAPSNATPNKNSN